MRAKLPLKLLLRTLFVPSSSQNNLLYIVFIQRPELYAQECANLKDEDDEFVAKSKSRHRRRLQDRWQCKTEGHKYCYSYTNGDLSFHIQLTETDLNEWVDSLVSCGFIDVPA
jgi:hypothetical protein